MCQWNDKNKIDQWDSSYPNSEIIKADIKASTYYIAEINNKIIGGINIDQNQDPTYLKISWQDKSNSFSSPPISSKRRVLGRKYWKKINVIY